MGDSSTEQKTELPEMSPEEQKMQALSMGFIDQYMEDSGYDVKEKQVFENPAKVESMKADIDKLQGEIGAIDVNHPDVIAFSRARQVPPGQAVGFVKKEKEQEVATLRASLELE